MLLFTPEMSLEPLKRADPERTLIILSNCGIEAEQGVNSNVLFAEETN